MRVLRTFVAEIMSTMPVLVKSIKSICRVKYPTEKDHTRGANLNLQVSPESWVSEILAQNQ
jgi:hypothetical protein